MRIRMISEAGSRRRGVDGPNSIEAILPLSMIILPPLVDDFFARRLRPSCERSCRPLLRRGTA